jgi:hypothetical protein
MGEALQAKVRVRVLVLIQVVEVHSVEMSVPQWVLEKVIHLQMKVASLSAVVRAM